MLLLDSIFDEKYYLETNPTAATAVEQEEFSSGLEHFQTVGIDEGLRFSPLIDLNYYKIIANPDLVELSNRDALDHLLDIGMAEGRPFSPFVDLNYYRQANPDLAELSNSEALLHLRDMGLDAGLEFAPFVDLEEYRDFAPELTGFTLSETFSHLATFYAPEDEGRIRMPLQVNYNLPDEFSLFAPEVVTDPGQVVITYSKADNEVIIELDLEGLPYRRTFTRSDDASSPFNRQMVTVEDSWWQFWINGEWFNFETNYWYDGATGDLIASEFDLPGGPIPTDVPTDLTGDGVDDVPLEMVTGHIMGSPEIFEGNPDGTANIRLEYTYDQLLDDVGSAGAYSSVLPYNINRPTEVGVYHTTGGLPPELAMNWDDILENIRSNGRVQFALSSEPENKPDFLAGRPNLIAAWGTFYPLLVPDNVIYEGLTDSYRFAEPADFTVHVNQPGSARQAEINRETETVFASPDADVLDAANPSDRFDGNRDTVFTGAGDDIVDASQATGPIFPDTAGGNHIYSGTGSDEVLAGGRRDRVFAGAGDDILDASVGSGNNRLAGGEGNDELIAGYRDRLMGGEGDDILDATIGRGHNRLYGQDGNDTFFLGRDDRLLGGDGDDSFFVTDGGNNVLTGGAGTDAFWITTGEFITTANTITDFELGVDVFGLAGVGLSSADDLVLTQQGDDALISLNGFDLVQVIDINVADLQNSNSFVFDSPDPPPDLDTPPTPDTSLEVEIAQDFLEAISSNDKEGFLSLQTSDVHWQVDGGLAPISLTETQEVDLIPFAGNWSGIDDESDQSVSTFLDEFQTSLSISTFETLDLLQDEDTIVARVNLEATVNETGLPIAQDISFVIDLEDAANVDQIQIESVDLIYHSVRVASAFAGVPQSPELVELNATDPLSGMPLSVNPDASSEVTRQIIEEAYLNNFAVGNLPGFANAFSEDGLIVNPTDPAFIPTARASDINTFIDGFVNTFGLISFEVPILATNADRAAVVADIEIDALSTGLVSDIRILHWLTVEDGSVSNLQILADSYNTASAIAGTPPFI